MENSVWTARKAKRVWSQGRVIIKKETRHEDTLLVRLCFLVRWPPAIRMADLRNTGGRNISNDPSRSPIEITDSGLFKYLGCIPCWSRTCMRPHRCSDQLNVDLPLWIPSSRQRLSLFWSLGFLFFRFSRIYGRTRILINTTECCSIIKLTRTLTFDVFKMLMSFDTAYGNKHRYVDYFARILR